MGRRLLAAFAALSFLAAVFVVFLWCRSYPIGESIEWRSTRWSGHDRRLARTFAVRTRGGQLTLACDRELRRVTYFSRASRDARDPARTTFHWEEHTLMEPDPIEPSFLNRLGFSKFAETQDLTAPPTQTTSRTKYRYQMPFWFLALVLFLPPAFWLYHHRRASTAATPLELLEPTDPGETT
jgi:hypothetical protein